MFAIRFFAAFASSQAHAVEGWVTIEGKLLDSDPFYANKIPEADTLDGRVANALTWYKKSELTLPLLIDDPQTNAMDRAFDARPDRFYIVYHTQVLYQGVEGPFQYDIDDALKALEELL